jgi:hypothetical protein
VKKLSQSLTLKLCDVRGFQVNREGIQADLLLGKKFDAF